MIIGFCFWPILIITSLHALSIPSQFELERQSFQTTASCLSGVLDEDFQKLNIQNSMILNLLPKDCTISFIPVLYHNGMSDPHLAEARLNSTFYVFNLKNLSIPDANVILNRIEIPKEAATSQCDSLILYKSNRTPTMREQLFVDIKKNPGEVFPSAGTFNSFSTSRSLTINFSEKLIALKFRNSKANVDCSPKFLPESSIKFVLNSIELRGTRESTDQHLPKEKAIIGLPLNCGSSDSLTTAKSIKAFLKENAPSCSVQVTETFTFDTDSVKCPQKPSRYVFNFDASFFSMKIDTLEVPGSQCIKAFVWNSYEDKDMCGDGNGEPTTVNKVNGKFPLNKPLPSDRVLPGRLIVELATSSTARYPIQPSDSCRIAASAGKNVVITATKTLFGISVAKPLMSRSLYMPVIQGDLISCDMYSSCIAKISQATSGTSTPLSDWSSCFDAQNQPPYCHMTFGNKLIIQGSGRQRCNDENPGLLYSLSNILSTKTDDFHSIVITMPPQHECTKIEILHTCDGSAFTKNNHISGRQQIELAFSPTKLENFVIKLGIDGENCYAVPKRIEAFTERTKYNGFGEEATASAGLLSRANGQLTATAAGDGCSDKTSITAESVLITKKAINQNLKSMMAGTCHTTIKEAAFQLDSPHATSTNLYRIYLHTNSVLSRQMKYTSITITNFNTPKAGKTSRQLKVLIPLAEYFYYDTSTNPLIVTTRDSKTMKTLEQNIPASANDITIDLLKVSEVGSNYFFIQDTDETFKSNTGVTIKADEILGTLRAKAVITLKYDEVCKAVVESEGCEPSLLKHEECTSKKLGQCFNADTVIEGCAFTCQWTQDPTSPPTINNEEFKQLTFNFDTKEKLTVPDDEDEYALQFSNPVITPICPKVMHIMEYLDPETGEQLIDSVTTLNEGDKKVVPLRGGLIPVSLIQRFLKNDNTPCLERGAQDMLKLTMNRKRYGRMKESYGMLDSISGFSAYMNDLSPYCNLISTIQTSSNILSGLRHWHTKSSVACNITGKFQAYYYFSEDQYCGESGVIPIIPSQQLAAEGYLDLALPDTNIGPYINADGGELYKVKGMKPSTPNHLKESICRHYLTDPTAAVQPFNEHEPFPPAYPDPIDPKFSLGQYVLKRVNNRVKPSGGAMVVDLRFSRVGKLPIPAYTPVDADEKQWKYDDRQVCTKPCADNKVEVGQCAEMTDTDCQIMKTFAPKEVYKKQECLSYTPFVFTKVPPKAIITVTDTSCANRFRYVDVTAPATFDKLEQVCTLNSVPVDLGGAGFQNPSPTKATMIFLLTKDGHTDCNRAKLKFNFSTSSKGSLSTDLQAWAPLTFETAPPKKTTPPSTGRRRILVNSGSQDTPNKKPNTDGNASQNPEVICPKESLAKDTLRKLVSRIKEHGYPGCTAYVSVVKPVPLQDLSKYVCPGSSTELIFPFRIDIPDRADLTALEGKGVKIKVQAGNADVPCTTAFIDYQLPSGTMPPRTKQEYCTTVKSSNKLINNYETVTDLSSRITGLRLDKCTSKFALEMMEFVGEEKQGESKKPPSGPEKKQLKMDITLNNWKIVNGGKIGGGLEFPPSKWTQLSSYVASPDTAVASKTECGALQHHSTDPQNLGTFITSLNLPTVTMSCFGAVTQTLDIDTAQNPHKCSDTSYAVQLNTAKRLYEGSATIKMIQLHAASGSNSISCPSIQIYFQSLQTDLAEVCHVDSTAPNSATVTLSGTIATVTVPPSLKFTPALPRLVIRAGAGCTKLSLSKIVIVTNHPIRGLKPVIQSYPEKKVNSLDYIPVSATSPKTCPKVKPIVVANGLQSVAAALTSQLNNDHQRCWADLKIQIIATGVKTSATPNSEPNPPPHHKRFLAAVEPPKKDPVKPPVKPVEATLTKDWISIQIAQNELPAQSEEIVLTGAGFGTSVGVCTTVNIHIGEAIESQVKSGATLTVPIIPLNTFQQDSLMATKIPLKGQATDASLSIVVPKFHSSGKRFGFHFQPQDCLATVPTAKVTIAATIKYRSTRAVETIPKDFPPIRKTSNVYAVTLKPSIAPDVHCQKLSNAVPKVSTSKSAKEAFAHLQLNDSPPKCEGLLSAKIVMADLSRNNCGNESPWLLALQLDPHGDYLNADTNPAVWTIDKMEFTDALVSSRSYSISWALAPVAEDEHQLCHIADETSLVWNKINWMANNNSLTFFPPVTINIRHNNPKSRFLFAFKDTTKVTAPKVVDPIFDIKPTPATIHLSIPIKGRSKDNTAPAEFIDHNFQLDATKKCKELVLHNTGAQLKSLSEAITALKLKEVRTDCTGSLLHDYEDVTGEAQCDINSVEIPLKPSILGKVPMNSKVKSISLSFYRERPTCNHIQGFFITDRVNSQHCDSSGDKKFAFEHNIPPGGSSSIDALLAHPIEIPANAQALSLVLSNTDPRIPCKLEEKTLLVKTSLKLTNDVEGGRYAEFPKGLNIQKFSSIWNVPKLAMEDESCKKGLPSQDILHAGADDVTKFMKQIDVDSMTETICSGFMRGDTSPIGVCKSQTDAAALGYIQLADIFRYDTPSSPVNVTRLIMTGTVISNDEDESYSLLSADDQDMKGLFEKYKRSTTTTPKPKPCERIKIAAKCYHPAKREDEICNSPSTSIVLCERLSETKYDPKVSQSANVVTVEFQRGLLIQPMSERLLFLVLNPETAACTFSNLRVQLDYPFEGRKPLTTTTTTGKSHTTTTLDRNKYTDKFQKMLKPIGVSGTIWSSAYIGTAILCLFFSQ